MTEILLEYKRSERKSNWKLHLVCVKKMVPYFFSAGHNKYARWVPVYLLDMVNLEGTAPEIHHAFITGKHSIYRSERRFASVWTDMTRYGS